MNGAAKFALGIVFLWLAGLCFFLSFHPNGVVLNGAKVDNPVDVLKWLIQEFGKATGTGTGDDTPLTDASGNTAPNNANAAPTISGA
jgi:hypothetical protein